MKNKCIFLLRQARLRMIFGMEDRGRRQGRGMECKGEPFYCNSVKAGRQEPLLEHRQETWAHWSLSHPKLCGVVALAGPWAATHGRFVLGAAAALPWLGAGWGGTPRAVLGCWKLCASSFHLISKALKLRGKQTDFWVILWSCGLVSYLLLKTDFNSLKQLGNFGITRKAQVLYYVKDSYKYN